MGNHESCVKWGDSFCRHAHDCEPADNPPTTEPELVERVVELVALEIADTVEPPDPDERQPLNMAIYREARNAIRDRLLPALSALPSREAMLKAERERCAKVAHYSRQQLEPFVTAAAMAWCGSKQRETSGEDVRYFETNWWSLPGLQGYVRAQAIRSLPPVVEGEDGD